MTGGDLELTTDRITARLVSGRGTRGGYSLVVGGTTQSHVNPDDPSDLQLEYVRLAVHAIEAAFPPAAPISALHLGGGALTIPRYLAHTRPGSEQHVVELYGELYDFVIEALPPAPGASITAEFADARAAVEGQPPGPRWDLVVVDVFSGNAVPGHCTTEGFFRSIAARLAPGGRVVVNSLLSSGRDFTREMAATLRAVFAHTAIIVSDAVLEDAPYGNLEFIASDEPLDLGLLERMLRREPRPIRVIAGEELDAFTGDAQARAD
ncbi:spermidine synthase [Agromyces archimandritae]|uniref:Fused MFS/spermidine synthase n=1 Tax=Agromyces archimandritae TaxID=2781962 RepID=A0A975FL23_9MICO|nr:fused MFS/spermidine synthase [Agromyces archimandritae]QTX04470.1 fused MFS/spermidine synthase [Agromyces archimandritae]